MESNFVSWSFGSAGSLIWSVAALEILVPISINHQNCIHKMYRRGIICEFDQAQHKWVGLKANFSVVNSLNLMQLKQSHAVI